MPMSICPDSPRSGSGWVIALLAIAGLVVMACGGACTGLAIVGHRAEQAIAKGLGEALTTNLSIIGPVMAANLFAAMDPRVMERLGEPVETVAGSERRASAADQPLDPAGETFLYDLQGPKGKALLSIHLRMKGSEWHADKVTVTFEDGTVIEIVVPKAQSPGAGLTPPDQSGR